MAVKEVVFYINQLSKKEKTMPIYIIASESFGKTSLTEPMPTIGLAIKMFFQNMANDRPNLDWVDGSYSDEFATKWMFHASSSERRDGAFYLKVVTVGNQSWLLNKDREENAGVMESVGQAIARSEPETRFNTVEYALQLFTMEAVDLTQPLPVNHLFKKKS